VTTPTLTITEPCEPLYEDIEEIGPGSNHGITCSPVPGGMVFRSEAEADIKLYTPDGRLAYSGNLIEGNNRISLETGVYLWKTGPYKGKAVVR